MELQCSRCKKNVVSALKMPDFTGGYYEVAQGEWSKYANPGEVYLCDPCMHSEPRYRAVYGPFI